MKKDILFVGLEVDDKAFHCYLVEKAGFEEYEFVCKPHVPSLLLKLAWHLFR